MKIGLQVYTVRDELIKDFEGTFKALKEMGYDTIELPGLFDRQPAELKSLFDELGFSIPAIMFPFHNFLNKRSDIIKTCNMFGASFAICPGLDRKYQNQGGFKAVAEILDSAAQEIAGSNITVCYHNHSFEFDKFLDGTCGYDILMSNTSAICFEPDVYWIAYAGHDPIEMLNKLKGRMPLLHLKDMSTDESRSFCEVGYGQLPISPIIDLAKKAGTEFAFVEQDANWVNNDSITSVKKSLDFLST